MPETSLGTDAYIPTKPMWGVVLANVAPGKEPEFFSNLGAIHQVRNVFYLFDQYEYLLEVEADSVEEMASVMRNHIRHLPGVERTADFIEGDTSRFAPLERETPSPTQPETTVY